jgi:hypothetical protein
MWISSVEFVQSDILRIRSAWRTALLRCGRLPYNSHSKLIVALHELRMRVIKFNFSCLNSTNEAVKFRV